MKYNILLFILAIGLFAGCSSSKHTSQPYSGPDGEWTDTASTASDEEDYDSLYDTSLPDSEPLPPRDESTNPENADYETLKAYTVHFSFDSFSIEADQRHKVENIATWMTSNPKKNIVIAGHCDARGTIQYNLALGERRALSVRDYLVGLGASKSRITTVSYGEERPAVYGDNEEAWNKNRRAEIGVLK